MQINQKSPINKNIEDFIFILFLEELLENTKNKNFACYIRGNGNFLVTVKAYFVI